MTYPPTSPDTNPPPLPLSVIPLPDRSSSHRSSVRALSDSVDAANTAKETERVVPDRHTRTRCVGVNSMNPIRILKHPHWWRVLGSAATAGGLCSFFNPWTGTDLVTAALIGFTASVCALLWYEFLWPAPKPSRFTAPRAGWYAFTMKLGTPTCPKCHSVLNVCECGAPAQCGELTCADHTDEAVGWVPMPVAEPPTPGILIGLDEDN